MSFVFGDSSYPMKGMSAQCLSFILFIYLFIGGHLQVVKNVAQQIYDFFGKPKPSARHRSHHPQVTWLCNTVLHGFISSCG